MAGSPKKRAKREQQIRNLPMVIAQPEVEDEFLKDRFGKSTKFKPEYIEIARLLCEDGATDKELASYLGIDVSTLYAWRNTIPALAAVMKLGKDIANDRLERTAFDVAVGYTTNVTVNVKLRDQHGNEKLVEVTQEVRVAPNPDMLRWMLKNRRPDDWRDKTEQVHSGAVVHLTLEQARERLKAKLEQIQLGNGAGAQAAG